MKQIKATFAAFALLAISASAFAGGGKANGKYAANTAQSNLVWKAEKVTGKHDGTVKLSGGEITVANDKLVAGSFTIDKIGRAHV